MNVLDLSTLRGRGDHAACSTHLSGTYPLRQPTLGLRVCASSHETFSNGTPCRESLAAWPTVQSLVLEFLVSKNEEYVRMYAIRGRVATDLGARNHTYLLLTLARRRISDMAKGLPEAASGWLDVDELAHDPSMAPPRLNLDVHRIRKQFKALALANPRSIVERRTSTREIRLGTGRIAIRPI